MRLFGFNLTERLLFLINSKVDQIMATQAQLAADLDNLQLQVEKIGGEVQTLLERITDLENAINNGPPVSPEVESALANLKAQVQVVDDLVPDA